jgi:hypothetical protein
MKPNSMIFLVVRDPFEINQISHLMLLPIATIQYLSSGSEFFLHGYHSIEIFKFFFYPKWLDKTQESKIEKEHELEVVITILWFSTSIIDGVVPRISR